MGKITETRKRYKETLAEITKSEEHWLSFLDSSSWNFKYDFADQVLIYTQRPDARACATMEVWNKKVKRWVNKNADFIFIFSKNENSQFPFELVFDVSDTHNARNTEYKLWSIKPEYEQEIVETLESNFGAETEEKTLTKAIISNAYNMVVDNIQDYMSSIQKYRIGSSLENLSDEEIFNVLVPTVWASVSYMMMTRCGIDARKEIDIQEFSYIKNFNSDKIFNILGTATSEIAEMGLREIARTVTNLQKEEKNRNHTFVKNQKQEYSNNKEIDEGGIKNGENRIHQNRRLQYTKSSNGNGENTRWQIRKDETTLSKETQESRIYDIIDGQEVERTLNTYTENSNTNVRTDSGEISETRGNNREVESRKSNEMDRTNEQLQDDSRRTDNDGLNLQLEQQIKEIENSNNILTEEQQIQNIAEVENTSVFSFSQEIIDSVLKEGSHIENGKFRIYEYLTRGLPEKDNVEFLKQEYGTGGRSADDNGVSEDHSAKGIKLSTGYKEDSPTLLLNWKQVAKRISELISQDRYFNELEKDEYYDWLDSNGIKTINPLEKQVKDEDYQVAERLHSYIKDYDIVSYNANFPIENTDEDNIELLKADINDESNIRDYIDFLKNSYADLDYDDENAVEARALLVELEKRLPYYEFHIGDIVYIGTDEFEIRLINDERVFVIDTKFPILQKEYTRQDFDKKVKENPANDKLRTGKRIQDIALKEEKDTEIIIETTTNEPETLENRFYKFLNEYDIYDVDEVPFTEVKETLEDKQKILDTVDYFYEILNSENEKDEFTTELKEWITELLNLYKEKDEQDKSKENIEIPKEEKLKVNIKPKRRNKIEYFDLHPEVPINERNNYTINNNDLGIGTAKEKYRRNIEAIKILKQCQQENRYATKEEQEILSQYVGWGGLQESFDPNNDSWSNEYKELKALLTEKEYEVARQSTLTAFYTPPIVIKSIYKALENMGLERGNILEPSCRHWKLYGNVTTNIKSM